MMNKGRRAALVAAGATLILGVGTVGAYFTDQTSVANKLTISRVETEVTELGWDSVPDSIKTHLTSNQTVTKDPVVTNRGTVDQFVFVKVKVPTQNIITANEDGTRNVSAETDLFALNNSEAVKNGLFAGLHTNSINDGWTLLKDEKQGDEHVYTYVWGTSTVCNALAPKVSTSTPLFSAVTMCNAVEGQNLEDSVKNINVEVYAIQTTDLTDADTVNPMEVLAVYYNQNK